MKIKQIIKKGKKIGKNIYQGTSKVGKVYSLYKLVTFIIIGLALIITGIVLLAQPSVSTSISDDADFPNDFDNDFDNDSNNSKNIGGGFALAFGIIIILIGVLNYYFVNKYKALAAYEGGNVIIDFFRRIF